MRLAIIRQRYAAGDAGLLVFERALEALLERNVAISLYTRDWPATRLQLIEPFICDPFYIGALWRDWGFARAVAHVIGDAKANLVQSHERLVCCDVYDASDGVEAVRRDESRKASGWLVRLIEGASPYRRYRLHAERRLFASHWLSTVICGSAMVRDEIRDRFGLPESKLRIVPVAVDCEAFTPECRADRRKILERHGIPPESTVFLVSATDFRSGGVGTAIEALAELPASAHLIVLGRDLDIGRYRRAARRSKVRDRVVFAGPQGDPRPYYGAADVFVSPALYDPSSRAVLEALACGLPAIVSMKSAAAALVLAGDAGLVCPSHDVAGLAAQMRALEDPDTRARLAGNARNAVTPFSPSAVTLTLVLIYRDLLAATVRSGSAARAAATDTDTGNRTPVPSTHSGQTQPPVTAPGIDSAAEAAGTPPQDPSRNAGT